MNVTHVEEIARPHGPVRHLHDARQRIAPRDARHGKPSVNSALGGADGFRETRNAAVFGDPCGELHACHYPQNVEIGKANARATIHAAMCSLPRMADDATRTPGGKQPRASDILSAVGERLRAARWELDPNRTRFAAQFGVKHTTWEKWEKGGAYPDPYVMSKLCQDYGLTMDYLYRGILAGMPNEDVKLALAAKLPAHLKAGPGAVEPAGSAAMAPAAARRGSADKPGASGMRRREGQKA